MVFHASYICGIDGLICKVDCDKYYLRLAVANCNLGSKCVETPLSSGFNFEYFETVDSKMPTLKTFFCLFKSFTCESL